MILLLIACSSFAADRKDEVVPKKVKCPVCGMYVAPFADWNAEITLADATRATFDGPKDMFKYYLNVGKYSPSKKGIDIVAVSVKDYYSKTAIDALQAFYVIWGDEYGPMGHEPVPFKIESDAVKYMKEHEGRKILRFKDITQKLLYSLDNPE